MRLCVVAPNRDYLKQAGVRIRYQRIESAIAELDDSISIELIENFRASSKLAHDAYLFSKCVDARACLLATFLKDAGKLVGVDLFDDYFSQTENSKFVPQREWLRSMAGIVDFFLCSTVRMKEVAQAYIAKPGHVLNDPYDSFDGERIAASATEKFSQAVASRRLEILWFGIGDNPHFPVGLDDLSAFGHVLHRLSLDDYEVSLRILTNHRALTVDGLEKISRLSVPYSIQEWDIDKEKEALSQSIAAFIPVNAQNFSIAKSMNRAVTALTAGTQVISAGYPLYAPLGGFIYRSAERFLQDLKLGQLALRKETVLELRDVFGACADTSAEVRQLSQWLNALPRHNLGATRAQLAGVVHGVRTSSDCHKQAQRLGYLSISSPFSTPNLNYDIRFVPREDGSALHVQFDAKALMHLDPELRRSLTPETSILGRSVQSLHASELYPAESKEILMGAHASSRAARLVTYPQSMRAVGNLVGRLLPGIRLFVSEKESPYFCGLQETLVPDIVPAEGRGGMARQLRVS